MYQRAKKSKKKSNQLKIDLKRIQKRCNINKHIEEFDNVLLKDGQTAAIVDKLSEDTFIADIGDSPEDWDTVTITIDDIKEVVYRKPKSIDG